jgi:hypothetical protein
MPVFDALGAHMTKEVKEIKCHKITKFYRKATSLISMNDNRK